MLKPTSLKLKDFGFGCKIYNENTENKGGVVGHNSWEGRNGMDWVCWTQESSVKNLSKRAMDKLEPTLAQVNFREVNIIS